MKLFFNRIILITLSFLLGCSSLGYQSPRYIKLAHTITAKTGKKLKEEKNLYLVGTGGQMMDDIQMMAMTFFYYQEVELKKARELIIYTTNEYLSAINENKEIRPYLHQYPFTAKNIEIKIFIYNPDRSELPPDKIFRIASSNGKVEYYTRLNVWDPVYEESYEEAVQKAALNQEVASSLALGQMNSS